MRDMLARLHHGLLIFCRRMCALLCAVFLVVGLFGCSAPTITLDLLRSLNPYARVEQSCHRVIGLNGEVHFGVHEADKNELIMDETPDRLIEAVKTADVITHYVPDSSACGTNVAHVQPPNSRVQLGVIWTLSAPPHELPELHLSPQAREALESSLAQACATEPGPINKVFFGQVMTSRNPKLTLEQAEEITHTLKKALRGHINELSKFGPLGPGFAEAHGQIPKPTTTVEPIDTPLMQGLGGAGAGIFESVAPGGVLLTQPMIDKGMLPPGTREAQAGRAISQIVVGAGQVFIGADGAIIGGGMSLTGVGTIPGAALCVGSLAIAANGAVTFYNGVKSLTIVLYRWEDEAAAGASAPSSPSAAPAPTTAAPPAAQPAQAPPAAKPPPNPAKKTAKPAKSAPSTGKTSPVKKPCRYNPVQTGNTITWTKCSGQEHHAISSKIHEALEKHPLLKGIYKPRDNRFVTQAIDKEAHKGYQTWHRDLDK
jgi:hypothetical protein